MWEVYRYFGWGLGGLDRGCTNDDCRCRFRRFVDPPCGRNSPWLGLGPLLLAYRGKRKRERERGKDGGGDGMHRPCARARHEQWEVSDANTSGLFKEQESGPDTISKGEEQSIWDASSTETKCPE